MKLFSLLILSLLNMQTLASSWPTFFYPDNQLIMDMNFFDNTGCVWNTVRLKPNVINISRYTCEMYCPPEWNWTARGDGQCHSFSDMSFKEYKIIHHADHDTVIALYGNRRSSEIYFEYEMNTLPSTSWYCSQYRNMMDYVVCANDSVQ